MPVRAEKADLSSSEDKYLLVEGIDDWHAIYHIISHVKKSERLFDIGYCDNDNAVLEKLSSVIVGSGTTKSILGAVLDADTDTGIAARLQSIRQSLESAYEIPDTFPPDGLILTPKSLRYGQKKLPRIGVWLMPDNVRDGIFEDLLCAAMRPESAQYIANVIDKAKTDEMAAFRNVERSKAIIKTHIAWQDPNKKNIGEAISSHFDNLAPACKPFLDWLDRLFRQDA